MKNIVNSYFSKNHQIIDELIDNLISLHFEAKPSKYYIEIDRAFNEIHSLYVGYISESISENDFSRYISLIEENMLYRIGNYNGLDIDDPYMNSFDDVIREAIIEMIK